MTIEIREKSALPKPALTFLKPGRCLHRIQCRDCKRVYSGQGLLGFRQSSRTASFRSLKMKRKLPKNYDNGEKKRKETERNGRKEEDRKNGEKMESKRTKEENGKKTKKNRKKRLKKYKKTEKNRSDTVPVTPVCEIPSSATFGDRERLPDQSSFWWIPCGPLPAVHPSDKFSQLLKPIWAWFWSIFSSRSCSNPGFYGIFSARSLFPAQGIPHSLKLSITRTEATTGYSTPSSGKRHLHNNLLQK